MNRVLISTAGTNNAFAAVRSLKNNFPDCYIVSADVNPSYLITASLFTDEHLVVPPVNDAEFPDFMVKALRELNIDTYIPFIDAEIRIAAELFEKQKISAVKFLQIKSPAIALICENKLHTYHFLSNEKLPTPMTSSLEQPFDADNYILKPITGFGSHTKSITRHELKEVLEQDQFILQEKCLKPEITVDVLYSKKYDIFKYVCRERIQVKAGVCSKARLFLDEKIGRIAHAVADALNIFAFCFQLMHLNGKWVITDINARLGGGTAMCAAAGLDFYAAMFAVLWDKDPTRFLSDFEGQCYVTRQYSEYLMV